MRVRFPATGGVGGGQSGSEQQVKRFCRLLSIFTIILFLHSYYFGLISFHYTGKPRITSFVISSALTNRSAHQTSQYILEDLVRLTILY